MNRNYSKGFTALFSVLLIALPFTVFAADEKDDFDFEFDAPDFANTSMPTITSCDGKGASEDPNSLKGIGKSLEGPAKKLWKEIKKDTGNGGDSDDEGDEDDPEDVDQGASIDTQCSKAGSLSTEGVKDLACKLITDEYLELKTAEAEKSKKALYCERGVLKAISGEVGCLKKQIADAERFIDSLVNSPGGLNAMLTEGNKTLQDRTSQLKTVDERINGGENQNPPGLAAAAKALQDLGNKLPEQVDAANAAVSNIRETQARFESLVKQVETASIMKCMNAPTPGYACVRKGTSSSRYPTGDVSPIALMQCIYAQSANKVVGGSVVRNTPREEAMFKDAQAKLTLKGDDEIRASADFPMFSDAEEFKKSFRTYDLNTPEQLLAHLKSKVGTMSVSGKNMIGQLDQDFARCKKQAEARTVADRADSSSSIRASQKSMDAAVTKIKSQNAAAFRALRNQYSMALKAATGQSILPDTQGCEKASIEEQSKCFDALNSMVDTLYTGKARSTDTALGGAAYGLTGGANPIRAFLGTVAAKNNPARSIAVSCAGVDQCLTKYTALSQGLKSFVEEYPSNLNTSIQSAATNLASGKDPNTGQPVPGMALTQVASNIEGMKAKLMGALSRMKVKDGLDLDPKKVDAPEIDEKTGLYKQGGLRNLVLQGINPPLPDLSSKGFSETIKAVGEADEKLEKKQEELEKYLTELESKKNSCESEAKKSVCDKATKFHELCMENAKLDKIDQTAGAVDAILLNSVNSMPNGDAKTKLLESLAESKKVKAGTALGCGTSETTMKEKCGFGEAVSDNLDKDEDEIGGRRKSGDAKKAGSAK